MHEIYSEPTPYASRAVGVLGSIALHHFNIELSELTIARLSDVMMLMRRVDDNADSPDDSQRLVRLLSILETFDVAYPRLSVDNLGPKRYQNLIKLAAGILRHGEEMRHATAEEYYPIRREEGAKTATAMNILVSDEEQHHPQFPQFTLLVNKLAIGAGYINTARGAKNDYADGILSFEPTALFRLTLLAQGAYELIPTLPSMMHLPVMYHMGSLAIQAYKSHRHTMARRRA